MAGHDRCTAEVYPRARRLFHRAEIDPAARNGPASKLRMRQAERGLTDLRVRHCLAEPWVTWVQG
jgi:hypothetical protein